VASARAGNVIGGGDWAADRLVPDLVRGAVAKTPVLIRNPSATRPWQHVLEPLAGYLSLAQALIERGAAFAGAWNFGPADDAEQPVSWIADRFCAAWGATGLWRRDERSHPHEAKQLKLDSTKARKELHWLPVWTVEQALRASADWYRAYYAHADMSGKTREQIDTYFARGAP
jgi:CDP-glucose 4,6-dehydratase